MPPYHRRPLPHSAERDPDEPETSLYDVETRRRLLTEIAATAPHVLTRLRDEIRTVKAARKRLAAFDAFLTSLGLESSAIARDLQETVDWWGRVPREGRRKHLRPLYPTIYPEAGPETHIRLYGPVDPRDVARVVRAHNAGVERHARGTDMARAPKRHTQAVHWLVRYHFSGEKYTDIAKDQGVTGKAVEMGVKEMARYFHIRLRPADKGGRRRGTKTREHQLRVTPSRN